MPENNLTRPVAIALASLAVIAAFYLLREHWGHALGLIPYLLLLACPLLHLFQGHGGHGRHHDGQPPERRRHDH